MENRPLKVEKIGGTSMADTKAVLNNVLLRRKAPEELYNRIVVVSAYAGVTDKLLEQKKTGEPGVYALFASAETGASWEKALDRVAEEMLTLNQKIFGDCADRRTADSFVRERVEGIRSCLIDLRRLCSYGHFHLDEHMLTVREMLSALGEAHSANNTALLLRQHGVNACFIDMTGWRDETQPTLDERIQSSLGAVDLSSELPIVTGYAHCREGLMRNFDRGYTEVTFSRIAVLLQASEAIIHKEFHLSSADPKIVGVEKVQNRKDELRRRGSALKYGYGSSASARGERASSGGHSAARKEYFRPDRRWNRDQRRLCLDDAANGNCDGFARCLRL